MNRPTAKAFALVVLAAITVGCTSSAPAASPSSPGMTGEMSAPALFPEDIAERHKFHVNPASGRLAVIDSTGGTISATGSGGSRFTLTIPPGAIQGAQPIGVFPIQSLGTLPSAAKLIAGVQLSPDGLSFAVPATLTIDLPNPPDAGAGAVGWHGDGDRLHRAPSRSRPY